MIDCIVQLVRYGLHQTPRDSEEQEAVDNFSPLQNVNECGKTLDTWTCTRKRKHQGRHIAATSRYICASWDYLIPSGENYELIYHMLRRFYLSDTLRREMAEQLSGVLTVKPEHAG